MIKDKLQTCDIFVFEGGGIFGKLIKWKTGEPYTHCGIYVAKDTIMEAGVNGVVTDGNGYLKNTKWLRYPNLTDTQKKYILRNALNYQGKGYDFIQVLLGLFRNILWRLPFNNSTRVNCSEFVARVFEDSGLPLGDKTTNPFWDLDFVTPGDIANSKKLKEVI